MGNEEVTNKKIKWSKKNFRKIFKNFLHESIDEQLLTKKDCCLGRLKNP